MGVEGPARRVIQVPEPTWWPVPKEIPVEPEQQPVEPAVVPEPEKAPAGV